MRPLQRHRLSGAGTSLSLWAAASAVAFAWGGLLLSRGRLHLDIGLGRSIHPLGPQVVEIDAPRDLVFETISAPYLGQMPAAMQSKLTVLERSGNLVVAEHRTKMPIMDAVTVESVHFDRPSRVTFRLLRGPVPHVTEEFLLEDGADDRTTLTYRGELGADLWFVGRFYAGKLVRPVWEATVSSSLEQVKKTSEARAAAHRRRGNPKEGDL